MNLTKCKNGHYYDADKYASCPHCGDGGNREDDVTVSMGQSMRDSSADTVSLQHAASISQTAASSLSRQQTSDMGTTVSLAQALNMASAQNPAAQMEDSGKTVGYYGGSLQTEPVVGWLVCIEGDVLGKAFELKNGKNFIGRSTNMDVVLAGDASVSRERHAIVTYEPKGRVFFAQPGESRELFYVDDQVVLMSIQLKDRSILSVGNTKLMFIPLCGPDFSWDDVSVRK